MESVLDSGSGSGSRNVLMDFRYIGLAEILDVKKKGEGRVSVAFFC